jgi:hypothetical protein
MAARTLNCPKCQHPLPEPLLNLPELRPCPNCETPIQVEVFPALFRPAQSRRAAEAILSDTEASCFHHAEKRAVVPCAGCGRFLCALCDCELNGQHYCPNCLETGRTKGRIKDLETRRTRYDNLALALSIFIAPAALGLVLWHWNTPRGLAEPSRAKLITAGVIALMEMALIAGLILV